MNQKVKLETESKYNLLKERLVENQISPAVIGFLKGMTSAVERNDFGTALNIHKELVKKTWEESKDWANALKVLVSFKQRFAQ